MNRGIYISQWKYENSKIADQRSKNTVQKVLGGVVSHNKRTHVSFLLQLYKHS